MRKPGASWQAVTIACMRDLGQVENRGPDVHF